MLSRSEYVAIRAALVRLAGENVASVADEIEALDWAIRSEDDIAEIKDAGGFRNPAAYRRIRAKHQRRDRATHHQIA